MAKKNLRAQMDAARAAAAFIGAAQEAAPVLSDEKDSDFGAQDAKGAAKGAKGEPNVPERAVATSADADEPATPAKGKRAARQVRSAASDVTMAATVPDFFTDDAPAVPARAEEELLGVPEKVASGVEAGTAEAPEVPGNEASPAVTPSEPAVPAKPKAARSRKPRKKAEPAPEVVAPEGSNRMTAQVLVPMTAEQREHADLLAQVMKVTRAEVMRQALDEYWENHRGDLQAAVAAYEQLIRKLMK
ncbi:hypothetical protein VJ918_02650 [Adlercreutzia sp. R21]|uniref:hypothetical protein n=1 Tax=Adlercreutzia wanghongyangiae TaxID=3111451 RepID=UPI002DB69E91|nr:hypothetical protein [Adlercreutzia sp. R21]MEC4183701.1 hypothetical protein [Adlercreutzia sp. R21]